jgi:hypothetical protein
MKTILRNTSTGFYLQAKDQWTESAETAYDFKSTERLIRFVRDTEANTLDLEMILNFDDEKFNIALPIDERFGIYAAAPGTENPRVAPRDSLRVD